VSPTERTFGPVDAPRDSRIRDGLRMHDHLAHPHLPPGPNRWPLRNLYRWSSDVRRLFEDSRRDFGDVFTLRFYGCRPMVCFASAEATRDILRDDGGKLGNANDSVQAVLGPENVPFRNGPPHLLHRRRLMPALTGEALFAHGATMREVIDEGIDRLAVGDRVAIVPWAGRVSLAVIQRCLFGMRDGAASRALADDVMRLAAEGLKPSAVMASLVFPPDVMLRVTRGVLSTDGKRLADPWWMRPMLSSPLVSGNRRLIDRLLGHVRAAREGTIDLPETSMLAVLLRLAEQQNTELTELTELTDVALCDDLITLLLAGHDTTAISFAWLALLLARHPNVTRAIRRELAEAGGQRALTAEQIMELPYLDATVRESMRLTPIAVGVGRTTLAPIRIAGVDLPEGVVVMGMSGTGHFDPSIYADASRFDPAHMLDRRVRPEHWFPFGGGYRRCVGASFAMLELKLLVAAFTDRVSFEAVDDDGELGGGTVGLVSQPLDRGLVRIDSIGPATRIVTDRTQPEAP